MPPQQPTDTPNQPVPNPPAALPQPNQSSDVILRRHPFGIVALYLQAAVAVGAALGLIFFLIPSLISEENRPAAMHVLGLGAVIFIVLIILFLLAATFIYNQNHWTITQDSISQFTQEGLFRRQNSQLSMANIEDVTAEQQGILAELFGFGTLKCETAGERSNFHFPYCPNPSKYAKIILDARERFINEEPEVAKRANELLNVPRS